MTYSQSDRIQNYWDYSYLRPAEKFLRLDQMRTKRYTGGVTGKLPIGTQVSVDVDYVDTDSSQWDRVNSLGQYIYPYRETSDGRAGVTLTQPLLRGFGPAANLSEIRVARASLAAADIAWRQSLARRLAGTGVNTYALHPGVVATDIWRAVPWPFRSLMKLRMISTEEGARTSLYCATSPDCAGETGLYYDKCRLQTPSTLGRDTTLALKLWRESERWLA